MKHLRVVTWARWRVADPYDNRFFTNYTASVLRPSFELPVACVSMSVVTAAGRVFLRFKCLEHLQAVFVVPPEYITRLIEGFDTAVIEAKKIQSQLATLMKAGNLAPGACLVRTDTGEIVAEAERIIKEHEGQSF